MKTKHIFFTTVALFYIAVIAGVFLYNLPNWCANPSGNGNCIITSFCK